MQPQSQSPQNLDPGGDSLMACAFQPPMLCCISQHKRSERDAFSEAQPANQVTSVSRRHRQSNHGGNEAKLFSQPFVFLPKRRSIDATVDKISKRFFSGKKERTSFLNEVIPLV